MKEKELWMKKLKEKLDNHSEPIPVAGWDQLEKMLAPTPIEKKIVPYRRWAFAAAAAILLALVSSLSLYFLGTPAADEIRHTQTPVLASSPDALPRVQQPDKKGEAIEWQLPNANTKNKNKLAKTERVIVIKEMISDEDTISVVASDEIEMIVEDVNVTTDKQTSTEQPRGRVHRPSSKDKLHAPAAKTMKKNTWSVGLAIGNSGGTSTQMNPGMSDYMSRISMAAVSGGMMQIPNDQTLVFEENIPYLRYSKQLIDIDHKQPISFGLNVRKNLGRHFSLETGLTYTKLSSDVQLSDSEQQIEQNLHYLGLPLRANWSFLNKKLVTLYVSGGGMVEKCVYGKLGSKKETIHPLQLSVSGAVGAQFNATKRLGIYVEPGVAYYFDDGSDVQTIRKENPFNFNLQAGVRLTY